MAPERFNDAERFLIENWPKVRLMEEAMSKVRNKYWELGDSTVGAFRERHPDLDWGRVYVDRRSGVGGIGVAMKAWPASGDWRPGFYIEGLRLELLTGEEGERPYGTVYVQPAAKYQLSVAEINRAVHAATMKLFSKAELGWLPKDEDREEEFWYYLPETRHQLLEMLLDGDGQKFADCIISHLDVLARFAPVLDIALKKASRKG